MQQIMRGRELHILLEIKGMQVKAVVPLCKISHGPILTPERRNQARPRIANHGENPAISNEIRMQLLNFTQAKMLEELGAQLQLHQVGRSESAKADAWILNGWILNGWIQVEAKSQLDRCASGFGNMDERNSWFTE
nr:hypothetical protein [Synechococcus sp. BO 8801]